MDVMSSHMNGDLQKEIQSVHVYLYIGFHRISRPTVPIIRIPAIVSPPPPHTPAHTTACPPSPFFPHLIHLLQVAAAEPPGPRPVKKPDAERLSFFLIPWSLSERCACVFVRPAEENQNRAYLHFVFQQMDPKWTTSWLSFRL
ncbi:hypothetical protein J6590_095344 [Homalodisca vitripennis]|nr:hypothetical protein J6590_095344 [Homalodisca vitripennis]